MTRDDLLHAIGMVDDERLARCEKNREPSVVTHREDFKMKITSVNVRKINKESSRMKGIASVLIDDSFAVHDIRIIEGDNGLFIAMPSRKTATGGYRDIAHPINPEVRTMFEEAIFEAYENAEEPTEDEE